MSTRKAAQPLLRGFRDNQVYALEKLVHLRLKTRKSVPFPRHFTMYIKSLIPDTSQDRLYLMKQKSRSVSLITTSTVDNNFLKNFQNNRSSCFHLYLLHNCGKQRIETSNSPGCLDKLCQIKFLQSEWSSQVQKMFWKGGEGNGVQSFNFIGPGAKSSYIHYIATPTPYEKCLNLQRCNPMPIN